MLSTTQITIDSCCAGKPALLRPISVTTKRFRNEKRGSRVDFADKKKEETNDAVSLRSVGLSRLVKGSLEGPAIEEKMLNKKEYACTPAFIIHGNTDMLGAVEDVN
jgi:hypothetical protein